MFVMIGAAAVVEKLAPERKQTKNNNKNGCSMSTHIRHDGGVYTTHFVHVNENFQN